ncbi:MAG: hypothetical protein MUE85_19665 [Microscillaceae bacterium]|jgi:catechol-2,3-dioxygenase|nr:hypothetical protein [Microscillaceae bacterium]
MRIKKIQLHTRHLSELELFYTQTLDFSVVAQSETAFTLGVGSSFLEFQLADESDLTSPNYHFAFNIPENQMAEAVRWLQSKAIVILPSENQLIIPFPNWNAHAVYFFDPAGNVVELIARHDLPTASAQPFSAQSILQISEIGLPVPAIEPFYKAIIAHLDLPMYSHISNLRTFCAAGDAEGLLIIVPLQRAWFPTQQINGIFPLKIWLESDTEKVLAFADLPYQVSTEKVIFYNNFF